MWVEARGAVFQRIVLRVVINQQSGEHHRQEQHGVSPGRKAMLVVAVMGMVMGMFVIAAMGMVMSMIVNVCMAVIVVVVMIMPMVAVVVVMLLMPVVAVVVVMMMFVAMVMHVLMTVGCFFPANLHPERDGTNDNNGDEQHSAHDDEPVKLAGQNVKLGE